MKANTVTILLASLCFLSTAISVNAQAWKGEVHPDIPALAAKAKKGDPAAMAEWAFHSMRCMGGLKYQPNRIFSYFTKSAKAGNAEGQVGLAHCYCFSVGTIPDPPRAYQLIKKPLKDEHPVALKILSHLHWIGTAGVLEDRKKSFELNQKSAAKGCIAARYNVAVRLIAGKPVLDVEKGMGELRKMHEAKIFPMASAHLLKSLGEHKIWKDHAEISRSCVQRISEFAKLNEPYALYRLGIFHREAGDLENAVSCFTQSAHLGNGNSWWELWRIARYGDRNDSGNIWIAQQDRENLAMRAFDRGVWAHGSLREAGWQITRRSWMPGYQEKFPKLEKALLEALGTGEAPFCMLHNVLGRLYTRAQKKDNPDLHKPAWARAHLHAHVHHGSNSASELASRYLKDKKTTENLARGYANALVAAEKGHAGWASKERKDWMESLMTPAAKKTGSRTNR